MKNCLHCLVIRTFSIPIGMYIVIVSLERKEMNSMRNKIRKTKKRDCEENKFCLEYRNENGGVCLQIVIAETYSLLGTCTLRPLY